MLAASCLTKRYAGQAALDGFTHDFARGATTALIGPSGCGKSTLLRTLIGLVTPDVGEVRWDGSPVAATDWPKQRQRIGFMVQGGGLFPHLTGRENVELLARHLERPTTWIAERTAELAQLVRLPETILERHPSRLSGGQQQRVALMRTLFMDPMVLLLDEPLGALDPLVRSQLQEDLKTIFARLGKTVVLVTHDLAEAAFLAAEIVLLEHGQIVQIGSPRDVIHRPRPGFAARFVGAHRSLTLAAPDSEMGGANRGGGAST